MMDNNVVFRALNSDFKDFEDALQNYAAVLDKEIDLILTRYTKDYKKSSLAVMTPDNYIKIISLNKISFYKFLLYFFGFKNKKINNVLLKFNLVHFHEVWNIRHHLLAFKLRRLSIPFIFSVHGHFDKWSVNNNYLIKKLFLYIFKKNFINSAGIQISSHDELKEARIFFNKKSILHFF